MTSLLRPARSALVATAFLLCSLPGFAPAQGTGGTLQKVADKGTIVVGYHESTPPFTYLTPDGEIMGYSIDFARSIVEAIKQELQRPDLPVKMVPFTVQSRLSIVQNGTADLSCGATTHTVERQKQVAFSNTIYIAGSRLMTRKDSGIRDFSDLTDKTVATFARSTSEKMLQKMNAEQGRRIHIVSTFDRGETPLSVLQAGQADAYMMDDALLHATVLQTWRPEDWIVTGTPQSFEAYGCILRKDDPAFKAVVDREIARLMISGEAEVLHRKWLQSPIPPNGDNLGMPVSDAMRALYKAPNDKPFY